MYTIISLYILLFVLSFIAYYSLQRNVDISLYRTFHLLLFAFLVVFSTFRNGDILPDYTNYLKFFHSNNTDFHIEPSFYVIKSIAKAFSGENQYTLFFIYALLGIGTKYYAITKYSPYVMYSLCIWVSSAYIVQDMIQIRASVAGGLLLIIIPLIERRKLYMAGLLTFIAFLFHNSAIIFIPIFFLNSKSINWKFWTICYFILLAINLTGINFYKYLNQLINIIPTGLINERISKYLVREYAMGDKINMFAPYIMLQTITCFGSMYMINKLKEHSSISILLVKTSFIGIFIYNLAIPGVSIRLSNLLSTVTIFLYPLILKWFPDKYKYIGSLTIIFISLLLISYFILIKHLVERN